jgi:N utilization substance protein B
MKPMGRRRRGREVALQLLYALDITHDKLSDLLAAPWLETMVPEAVRDFAITLVTGVVEQRETIDTLVREWSANWSLDRIGVVERNILRFAIYELLFLPEIPPNVTINEAVEVAKRYGTEESPSFINGILDRIKHEVLPCEVDEHSALPDLSESSTV